MHEPVRNEESHPVDPSVAVSVALAEIEILRAETSIALAQLQVTAADQQPVHDLSPLGQRHL